MKCANCHYEINDDDKFCPNCGQSTATLEESFWVVLRSQLNELLDIDGRLARTVKVLLAHPGELSYAFNQGKRQFYTPPLRLYLAVSILFFLLLAYLGPLYAPDHSVAGHQTDYYAKAMFVLFPIFALLNQLFFRTSRFLGNLVFSLHIHTIVYLALIIIAPLEANEARHVLFVWLQLPPAIYLGWYYFSAYKRVYAESWLMILIKAGAIFMIYMGLLGIAFDVVLTKITN